VTNTVTLPFPAFYYPTLGASAASLTCLGFATTVGNAVQLGAASPAAPTSSAAWNSAQVRMDIPWTSEFTFTIPAGTIVEGFAFAIQNQALDAMGEAGMNLGLTGMRSTIAAIIGMTSNAVLGAWPSPPFAGIVGTSGTAALSLTESSALAMSAPGSMPATLADGKTHQIMVTYVPGAPTGRLRVYLDSGLVPVVQAQLNVAATLGLTNNLAWVGLTSGNIAADTGTVQILSWSFAQSLAARIVASPTTATGSFAAPTASTPNPPAVAGPFTASLQVCTDGFGNTWAPGTANVAIPVQISSTSSAGLAATDPAGADTTTIVTIPAGGSQTTFYYADPAAGTASVTGTPTSAPDISMGGVFSLTVTSTKPPVSPLPSALFSYPSFSLPDGPGLNLLGNAKVVGSALSLVATTDPVGSGVAWYPTKVNIALPWTTQFSYQIPASGGSPEGLAFVIQSQGAGMIGSSGPYLGFGGIQPTAQAVMISLTSNPSLGSWPAPPFIAVVSAATGQLEPTRASAVAPSPSAQLTTLEGSQTHQVTITYTPSNGGLVSVYLDGGTQPVTTAAINVSGTGIMPISTAWIGLTSTNGAGANNATVHILSWSFGPTHEPELTAVAAGMLGAVNPTTGVAAPAVIPVSATVEVSGDANGGTWMPASTTLSVPFALTSTSPTGQFSATAGGTAQSTIDVPAGASAVTFFYSDTAAGQATITGTPQVPGIAGFTIPVLIVPPG
jgi:Legume lectin domain/Bacterial lectin